MLGGKKAELLSIAIDVQGSEVVRPYVEKAKTTFATVVDQENQLSRSCGFKAVPNGYFLEPDGTISYVNRGSFDIRLPKILSRTRKWINRSVDPLEEHPLPGGEEMSPDTAVFFNNGLQLYREGKEKEAIFQWRKIVNLDPDNYIVRKQIWAIMHPEKFYNDRVDFDWQREQMLIETSAEK